MHRFWRRTRSEGDSRTPILLHIRAHLRDEPGLAPGGDDLPDEDLVDDGFEARFAPGALEGVLAWHASPAMPDEAGAAELAQAIRNLARRPGTDSRAALHAAADDRRLPAVLPPAFRSLGEVDPPQVPPLLAEVRKLLASTPYRGVAKVCLELIARIGDPSDLPVVRDYARHEEFTLWALTALTRLAPDPERELLALAPRVTSWGRVHVVERLLESPTAQVCEYLVAGRGFANAVHDGYTAYQVAVRCRLDVALDTDPLDARFLRGALRILASLASDAVTGGPDGDLDQWPAGLATATALVERHGDALVGLDDVNALVELRRYAAYLSGDSETGRAPGAGERLREGIDQILMGRSWADAVAEGLRSDDRAVALSAANAGAALGIPVTGYWVGLLERDPGDAYAWQQLVAPATQEAIEAAVPLARRHLLDADGRLRPEAAAEPGRVPPPGPPFALSKIVEALAHHPGTAPDLLVAALDATPALRWTALATAKAWDVSAWTPEIRARVQAAANDPVERVRQLADELLRTGSRIGAGGDPMSGAPGRPVDEAADRPPSERRGT